MSLYWFVGMKDCHMCVKFKFFCFNTVQGKYTSTQQHEQLINIHITLIQIMNKNNWKSIKK